MIKYSALILISFCIFSCNKKSPQERIMQEVKNESRSISNKVENEVDDEKDKVTNEPKRKKNKLKELFN